MNVYLMRHGETEYNVARLVQGACDSPLTKNGLRQAENAARRLRDIPFAAAYASPLKRAKDTAKIVAAPHKGLCITEEESLREFSFGIYETHNMDGLKDECPGIWALFTKTPSRLTAPGGDCTLARVAESKRFTDKLIKEHFGENVLCVSHGFGISFFLAAALGIPLESARCFASGNTALTILQYKTPTEPAVRVFGDTSHNE